MSHTAALDAADLEIARLLEDGSASQADLDAAREARYMALIAFSKAASPAEMFAQWVKNPGEGPVEGVLQLDITADSDWIYRADLWLSTDEASARENPLFIEELGDQPNPGYGALGLSLALAKDMSDEDCSALADTINKTVRAYQPEPTRFTREGEYGMWVLRILDQSNPDSPVERPMWLWTDDTAMLEDHSRPGGQGEIFKSLAEAMRHVRDRHWAYEGVGVA